MDVVHPHSLSPATDGKSVQVRRRNLPPLPRHYDRQSELTMTILRTVIKSPMYLKNANLYQWRIYRNKKRRRVNPTP
jgi:hypothetical protein